MIQKMIDNLVTASDKLDIESVDLHNQQREARERLNAIDHRYHAVLDEHSKINAAIEALKPLLDKPEGDG